VLFANAPVHSTLAELLGGARPRFAAARPTPSTNCCCNPGADRAARDAAEKRIGSARRPDRAEFLRFAGGPRRHERTPVHTRPQRGTLISIAKTAACLAAALPC
jgi:hypothetical protein